MVLAIERRKAHPILAQRACLALLSGRRHKVLCAVTLVDAEGKARHKLATSIVAFKPLSQDEIDAYVASDEWRGKAGGYALQGYGEVYVRHIAGSYSNVVGLPLAETRHLLKSAGFDLA